MEILLKKRIHVIAKKVLENIKIKCGCDERKILLPGFVKRKCEECGDNYIKWSGVKSRYCCVCRMLFRKIKLKEGVFKIKKGYPKNEALQTMGELNDYFAHKKITCLLCGNDFSCLGQHMGPIHGITTDEYKQQFGLPFKRGLLGTVTQTKHSEASIIRMENQDINAVLERLWAAPKEGRKKARGCGHSPAMMERKLAIAKKAYESEGHISKKKDMVDAYCSDCGDELDHQVRELTVITKGCILLCKRCKGLHHKKSQEKWARNKGINLKEYKAEISRKHHIKKMKGRG